MKISLIFVRNIFLAVFILATLAAFAISYRESSFATGLVAQSGHLNGPPDEPHVFLRVELDKLTPIIASVITSLTTLVGFVLTTMLNIRKEKRGARESALSLKQKELDLQRTLLELDELKKKIAK